MAISSAFMGGTIRAVDRSLDKAERGADTRQDSRGGDAA
jgi:hypothetical protein